MTEELDISRLRVVCEGNAKQELAKIIREYRRRHNRYEASDQLGIKKQV